MTAIALTKCSRPGCEVMTPNTFCSRECNRLAHCGPGTRSPKPAHCCGASTCHHALPDVHDQARIAAYHQEHVQPLPQRSDRRLGGSSNARRLANIRKRRMEREALAERRRQMRRRKLR